MVTNVTSLTGNGLRDWLVQRVTAVYLLLYAVLFFVRVRGVDTWTAWQALWHETAFGCLTLLALAALSFHAWIGLWTVTTDYLKCTRLRLGAQILIGFGLSAQFVWALMILWGQ